MTEQEKVVIPDGVAPVVREIIAPIIEKINAGGLVVDTSGSDESNYGHALRNLAHKAFGAEKRPEQEQINLLKERAQMLVDRFGPKIVEMMDPKLLEALEIVK
jgi:hypothetical protein